MSCCSVCVRYTFLSSPRSVWATMMGKSRKPRHNTPSPKRREDFSWVPPRHSIMLRHLFIFHSNNIGRFKRGHHLWIVFLVKLNTKKGIKRCRRRRRIRREDLFLMKHFDKLLSRIARASLAVPPVRPVVFVFLFLHRGRQVKAQKKMLMAFCLGALFVSGEVCPECITHPLLQSHNN